ncbi:hypothetical protein Cni_G12463 [Canna indica]|uniref:NPH3 domain-containing protein n=1 Tax=Canna indica TaxID=4628 RepID=A0AAQ3KAQ0_9LILI|nr:hypothetical protein Cni_G12463 [Canna indica]
MVLAWLDGCIPGLFSCGPTYFSLSSFLLPPPLPPCTAASCKPPCIHSSACSCNPWRRGRLSVEGEGEVVDAITADASASDQASLFGWPVNKGRRSGGGGSGEQILWNGIEIGLLRRRSDVRSSSFVAVVGSWFEDLAILSLSMCKRVIAAMKAHDLSSDAIEGSLISYAQQSIPDLSRSRRKHSSAPVVSESEQPELLEMIITNLPLQKTSAAVA